MEIISVERERRVATGNRFLVTIKRSQRHTSVAIRGREFGLDCNGSVITRNRFGLPPQRMQGISPVEERVGIIRFDRDSFVVTGDGLFMAIQRLKSQSRIGKRIR